MLNIFIETDEDLERLLVEYDVPNLDSLSHKYHMLTGGEIIDHRDSSEYTNINAQSDPDFWQEESITA